MPGTPTVQERTMRVREVLMRAVQREISWIQAADILGISARNMRRWKVKFETAGLEGVLDRRTLGHANPRRVTRAELERLLALYQKRYQGVNVRHFCATRGANTVCSGRTASCGRPCRWRDWSRSAGRAGVTACAVRRARALARCCTWTAACTHGWPCVRRSASA